jgi:hypothetical protein
LAPRHSLEESQNRQGAITGDGAQQLGSSIAAKADPNAWKSHGKISLEVVSPPKFLKAFCKYIRKSIPSSMEQNCQLWTYCNLGHLMPPDAT